MDAVSIICNPSNLQEEEYGEYKVIPFYMILWSVWGQFEMHKALSQRINQNKFKTVFIHSQDIKEGSGIDSIFLQSWLSWSKNINKNINLQENYCQLHIYVYVYVCIFYYLQQYCGVSSKHKTQLYFLLPGQANLLAESHK